MLFDVRNYTLCERPQFAFTPSPTSTDVHSPNPSFTADILYGWRADNLMYVIWNAGIWVCPPGEGGPVLYIKWDCQNISIRSKLWHFRTLFGILIQFLLHILTKNSWQNDSFGSKFEFCWGKRKHTETACGWVCTTKISVCLPYKRL